MDPVGTRVALPAGMLTVMFALVLVAAAMWALNHRREGVIELDESDLMVGPPIPVYAKVASRATVRSRNA